MRVRYEWTLTYSQRPRSVRIVLHSDSQSGGQGAFRYCRILDEAIGESSEIRVSTCKSFDVPGAGRSTAVITLHSIHIRDLRRWGVVGGSGAMALL